MNYNNQLPFTIGADNQYILYYSNFCINSKEFIGTLSKSPLYSKFTKINVSSNSYPSIIKSVPTIIVPKHQKPLVGIEVFSWLEKQSEEKEIHTKQGINAYSNEMDSNFGDSYSYLGSSDTNQPMEHTFHFISRSEQKIQTPPEEVFSNKEPKVQALTENRELYPQTKQPVQKSSYGKPPMIPLNSTSTEGENVENAYNELLARRKLDC
jgi:multidrug efflux pump subunit AcrB